MVDQLPDTISRRTLLKGAGVAATGAAVGAYVTDTSSAADRFRTRYANPRVREAEKVWARGYRGRADRTIALDDSGIDIRHPDLAPWNEVTAIARETRGDNRVPEIHLANPGALEAWDRSRRRVEVDATTTQTAVLGPGTTIEGTETTFPPFTPPEGKDIIQLDAELSWTPDNVDLPVTVLFLSEVGEDQSFRIELNLGTPDEPEWFPLQSIDTGSNPESLTRVPVTPGRQHRFVAGQFANVAALGEVSWTYHAFDDRLETVGADAVSPSSAAGRTPKTVGWFDAGDRYGQPFQPEDPNAHGSHVSGIMVGSGRASSIDPDRITEDAPRAVLTAGDVITYEVEARPGTGVFGVATGEAIEVVIEGPRGNELRSSGVTAFVGGDKEALPVDDARVDHPTVDERHPTRNGERQPATYRVHVRPSAGEAASTGQVEEVAVGAFLDPEDDRAGDRSGNTPSLNSGIAPDQGLFGMQGLSGPAASMALFGEQLTSTFDIRAINMSWGGVVPGGGTLGATSTERVIKRIAESGVLTVAAAGNTFGSPTGVPALADEAIAVSSTNFVDGITSYTDGGAMAQDEDGQGTYEKPDVCAPGGSIEAGARSVKAKSEGATPGVDGVRDYVNFPGTSMASPYVCGVSALVAQAMEEDAPSEIELPPPTETGLADVLRLKSVLLATASTTARTAAPYHRHPVRYVHDGRDTYEGYGRVNPDAAVDAVTRDLLAGATADEETNATSATRRGTAGLNVPDDPRAFAGYVQVGEGTLDVSVEHSHYSGGNEGMPTADPHLDVFVYDAENPGQGGDPNTLASALGPGGVTSVTVDVQPGSGDAAGSGDGSSGTATRTLFVVVKLVDVPGVHNGFDVRTNFDVAVSFESTSTGGSAQGSFSATGSWTDDADVYTRGQTTSVEVTVESFSDAVAEVSVGHDIPAGWTVLPYGDARTDERVSGPTTVTLGTVSRDELGTGAATKRYYLEATGDTGQYTLGPATADIERTDPNAHDFENGDADTFGGTDTNTVVGVDQNDAP